MIHIYNNSTFFKERKNYTDILKDLQNFSTPIEQNFIIAETSLDLESSITKEESLIVKGVSAIFSHAINLKATDIHIEPNENTIRIRYRVDGKLLEKELLHISLLNPIISRLKFLTNLDISEKRLPQDGRMKVIISERTIDFRISTIPTIYGEKAVIRILDKAGINHTLNKIGFELEDYKKITETLRISSGLILVTGPTGSGKSTTLYSILNHINNPYINISTIEDPVEYNIKNVNQIQIKQDIGLTFSSILRQVLRQDPDVIMVGEIRDSETAHLAIKSALTGHLIFSTLHTKDAISSVNRLKNLGIDNYLIANTIKLLISQRLIPLLCPKCKTIDLFSQEKLFSFSEDIEKNYEQKTFYTHNKEGCEYCNFLGYKGRIPVIELIEFDSHLRFLIESSAPIKDINEYLLLINHTSLFQSSMKKALSGLIALDDIFSIL